MTDVIPTTNITRSYQYFTLGELFEKEENKDGSIRKVNFDHNLRNESGLRFRIPEHQRFPQWKLEKQRRLVESIFKNFPMSGIILSKRIQDNTEFFDIEDGQTRLSTLQDYYDDKFSFEGYKFSQLPDNLRRNFERYKINVEIIEHAKESEIYDIFENLQMGVPLKDYDKYWNRKETPLVGYALELIEKEYWPSDYLGTSRGITSKERKRISDVCGFICAIVYGEHYITPSFRTQFDNLKKEISPENQRKIKKFLQFYKKLIDRCYSEKPKNVGERVRPFYNLAKELGMIIYEYYDDEFTETDEEKIDMWVYIINRDRIETDFMKGKKELWDGMTSAHRQNTSSDAIAKRVEKVRDTYSQYYALLLLEE